MLPSLGTPIIETDYLHLIDWEGLVKVDFNVIQRLSFRGIKSHQQQYIVVTLYENRHLGLLNK